MQTQIATGAGRLAYPGRQQALASVAGALLVLAVGMGLGVEVGRTLPRASGSESVVIATTRPAPQPFVFAHWGGVSRLASTSAAPADRGTAPAAQTVSAQAQSGRHTFCWHLCPPLGPSTR